jgi:hypothetical protein
MANHSAKSDRCFFARRILYIRFFRFCQRHDGYGTGAPHPVRVGSGIFRRVRRGVRGYRDSSSRSMVEGMHTDIRSAVFF